jgi:hypothetical protein
VTRLGDWQILVDAKTPPRAPRPGETAVLELGIAVASELNQRGDWRRDHFDRTNPQRYQLQWAWVRAGLPRAEFTVVPSRTGKTLVKRFTTSYPPTLVHLVRLAARELDDDNLPGAFKHVRDEIAELLGFNDRRKVWRYAEEPAPPRTHAIRIEVTWP